MIDAIEYFEAVPVANVENPWQLDLQDWLGKYRKFPDGLITHCIHFFERAFTHTQYPRQLWFGIHATRTSLVVGGLYVAAIHRSADDDEGLWILVDQNAPRIKGLKYRSVKATEKSKYPLQWGYSASYDVLVGMVRNEKLWESFASATRKVMDSPLAKDRDIVQLRRKKTRLSDFWSIYTDPYAVLERGFLDEVNDALADGRELHLQRLAQASKIPRKIKVETRAFVRNPDVVAEVLFRANGKCESCCVPAPFLKKVDGTPYLEVHHRIPLSDDGEDSVENAIALCPNCHRKAHYG
ncbi:MAG: HNH endonuclease signature motif containing protein [Thiothrix sp.]|uniref:HNH endonuclease n=1 Tax=Thiothrix sp. TaxID=1032 RepID=UPI00260682EC|nr:HNH endonuclease signature motif containing protein [Thiothrix sp.]MDD5392119.1 HNH endonuclease signature motif containing protein [Thiothrix sp.]